MGAASTFDGITTLIVGDNSFLYDSNALWIKNRPPSLRIIVIQNGGGGIFRFFPAGPSGLEEVEELFETPHDVDIERLAEVHRFKMYRATDAPSLESALSEFYQPGQQLGHSRCSHTRKNKRGNIKRIFSSVEGLIKGN